MDKPVFKAQLRIMAGSQIAIGPGKADLLQAIAETGSISAAGRRMGMSYRRAWVMVDTMNRCFREPVVLSAVGGSGGGGAQLSVLGQQVLAQYRQMQADVESAATAHVHVLQDWLGTPEA